MSTELSEKLKQLDVIGDLTVCIGAYLAAALVWGGSFVGFCATLSYTEFLESQGWQVIWFLVSLFGGLAAAAYTYDKMRSIPFGARIDGLLSNYSPVDIDGYRRLQEAARVNDKIDERAVYNWLLEERDAVKLALSKTTKSKFSFVNKSLSDS